MWERKVDSAVGMGIKEAFRKDRHKGEDKCVGVQKGQGKRKVL